MRPIAKHLLAPAPDASGVAAGPDAGSPAPANLHAESDEALMARYAQGDMAAFERLYDRHEGGVYRYLLRSVHIAEVAEELLQEVWMGVIRSADRYEARALFTTWLYRVARTRLIDHWRARDPVLLVSLDAPSTDEAGNSLVENLAAEASSQPEVLTMDKAQARAFVRAVEDLPPAQREAFLLHLQTGLSLAQVASITGAPIETVKSRVRYASTKLRGAMQAWGTGR